MFQFPQKSRCAKTAVLVLVATFLSVTMGYLIICDSVIGYQWFLPTLVIPIMVSAPIGYYVFGREELIAHLNVSLLKQISEDMLTKAMSRQAFFDLCPQGMVPSDGVMMIADLDHFKMINDTYGHAAGDAVLVKTVAAMQRVIGPDGYVARLGGEEFAIWLPGCDTAQGRTLANRVCNEIERELCVFDGHTIRFTISIGASFARRQQPVASLMAQADAALYRAKSAGRNGVDFHIWGGSRTGLEAGAFTLLPPATDPTRLLA